MIVLSRKKSEQIVIGLAGDIIVEIIEIRGDKVRLGIYAPVQIPVHRKEVYEAIQRENQKSQQSGGLEKGVDDSARGGSGAEGDYKTKLYPSHY